MDAKFVKFRYGPSVHTVAIYPGLGADEFLKLLTAVYPVPGQIVGLHGEDGLIVPMTLACRNPEILTSSHYALLVEDFSNNAHFSTPNNITTNPSAPPMSFVENNAPPSENPSAYMPPVPPLAQVTSSHVPASYTYQPPQPPIETAQPTQEELEASDPQLTDDMLDELLRFIAGLRVKKILTKQEAASLEELLFENSPLILAAYSVAKSVSDAQYLAEILHDIAQSLQTTAGRAACAAQEVVLRCCDELYMAGELPEGHLLFLRHLVLIRDDDVATAYEQYEVDEDYQNLAMNLYEIAFSHPRNEAEDSSSSSSSQSERDEKQPANRRKTSPTPMQSTIQGVISLMYRAGDLTTAEAILLEQMANADNEYIVAAYDLFENDGDLAELEDTLMRCAKLELRKRGYTPREEMRKPDAHAPQKIAVEREYVDSAEDSDSTDMGEEESSSSGESSGSGSESDAEESSNDSDVENLYFTQLTDLLSNLGVTNMWENTVPQRFMLVVFAAAQKKMMTIGQARALCDLYQAQYDLVLAAWEVYNVQGDAVDFIDTLIRIVRDLHFNESGDVAVNPQQQRQQASRQAAVDKANEEAKQNAQRQEQTRTVQQNRSAAMAAVADAKKELLKHSLEMMVKQGLIQMAAATSLYERYLEGEELVDAAIDEYANNRDVTEFLDTLQILANNSREDLEAIMRSAFQSAPAAEDEEEENEERVQEVEEDGLDENMDTVQKQLQNIVEYLASNGLLTPDAASALIKLIVRRDDRVMAAFDVYCDIQDKEDLVDSLLRIARNEVQSVLRNDEAGIEMLQLAKDAAEDKPVVELEMATRRPAASIPTSASNNSMQYFADSEDNNEEAGAAASTGEGLLNSNDKKSILEILSRAGALDDARGNALLAAIDRGDPQVTRIFLDYERTKDVFALIEALKGEEQSGSESEGEESSDEVSEAEDSASDGSEADDENGLDEDDRQTIESRFLGIVQNMNLSHLETAALRLAIARDDPAIRQALDEFRGDLSERNLMSTLREVAKKTIDETLNEAGYDGVLEDDEDEEEEGSDGVDDQEDSADSDDGNEDDGDGNEGSEEGIMSSQFARNHVFPVLLSELVKEHILEPLQGEKLYELFSDSDAVINAALDVYDLDSDMAELVDTLQRVVSLTA